MSDWKIIVPEATVNMVLNPSAEELGNFAALPGAGVARDYQVYSHYGLYSYEVTTNADNEGIALTLEPLANAIHYVTVRAVYPLPTTWDWSVNGGANSIVPDLLYYLDDTWALYGAQFPAWQCNGSAALWIQAIGGALAVFHLDGIQVEEKTYWTTYCDGTQEGCEWSAEIHGSYSVRDDESRAGGRLRDLQDDYHFDIGGMMDFGPAPRTLLVQEFALLPGGELSGLKENPRLMALTGVIHGSSTATMHAYKETLYDVMKPDAVIEDDNGPQPFRLWYTGADCIKEASFHYQSGLEGRLDAAADPCFRETIAVQLLAFDPLWYGIGEESIFLFGQTLAALDTIGYGCVARLRDYYLDGLTAQPAYWYGLNLGAGAIGAGPVRAIAVSPIDGHVYVGGEFTGWGGVAGNNYLMRYDPVADTWALPAGVAPSAPVRALAFDPTGILHIGGDFLALGGAGGDYVSTYDPVTNVYAPLLAGGTNTVRALAFDHNGDLYIGGDFVNWAALGADYLVMWDRSAGAYLALAANPGACVRALALNYQNKLYIGGDFIAIGVAAHFRIAEYDINAATFNAMGAGMNAEVRALAVRADGTVYAGGDFTTADGNLAYRVAWWNGATWLDLDIGVHANAGAGCPGDVFALAIGYDDVLYVGGDFESCGSNYIYCPGTPIKWNGASWQLVDRSSFTCTREITALAIRYKHPVTDLIYELYVGYDDAAGGYMGCTMLTNHTGTTKARPWMTCQVLDTGTDLLEIFVLRNELNGLEVGFDYALLPGERILVDFRPRKQQVWSNVKGNIGNALLGGYDFGEFHLKPGANVIDWWCLYTVNTTASDVVAGLLWRATFSGFED